MAAPFPMKRFLVIFCIAGFSLLSSVSRAQACPVAVLASVDLAEGPLSLADLLAPSTCPQLRRAAAGVRLGSVPLAGSARVILGSDVAILLEKLPIAAGERPGAWRVPPRVTVRRAGPRASCADLEVGLRPSEAHPGTGESFPRSRPNVASPGGMECGAAGRIPRFSPVAVTRTVWNSTRANWEVSARCVRPTDCVPFLVSFPGPQPPAEMRSSLQKLPPALSSGAARPLVRSGQTVTLLWDQDGLRLVVAVVCLDGGAQGAPVRARMVGGGRVVRAIVESAGTLRAAL
jgi:hypothetical protein